MESLIIAIISLLISLPIIYYLPVGFTKMGKLLILFFAFLVFIIGIALKSVMTVWQTGLVLILLAIGASYFIGRRYGNKLFIHDENNAEFEDKVIKFEIEDDIEEEIRSKASPEIDKALTVEPIIVSPLSQPRNEEFVEEIGPIDIQKNDDFVLENIQVEKEEIQTVDDINKTNDFDELLKEIERELNNNEIQKTHEVNEETDLIQEEVEDDILITPSTVEEIQIDSLQVSHDVHLNEESSMEEIQFLEPFDNRSEEIELVSTEEDVIHSVYDNNESTINEELLEVPQNQSEDANELEELEESDILSPENEHYDKPKDEYPGSELVEVVDVEESTQEIQDNNHALKQQLFATMISQIKISRNKVSNSKYERIILDHLNPELSDHDYYTFVSLLIEHYLHTGQIEELSSLLSKSRARFEKYPVILQEINFIVDEYCKI